MTLYPAGLELRADSIAVGAHGLQEDGELRIALGDFEAESFEPGASRGFRFHAEAFVGPVDDVLGVAEDEHVAQAGTIVTGLGLRTVGSGVGASGLDEEERAVFVVGAHLHTDGVRGIGGEDREELSARGGMLRAVPARESGAVFAIENEPDGFGEKGILGEFFNGDFHLEKAFRILLIRVRAVSGSRSQMRYLRAQ